MNNWRGTIDQHRRMIMNIVIAVVVLVLLVLVALQFTGATYVRIVDMPSDTKPSAVAPGADINAVEIHKVKKGKSYFAVEVVNHTIPATTDTANNNYTDPATILGDPALDSTTQYASLGGGEVILKVDARLSSGDRLLVHEIGAQEGVHAEQFEVYTSRSTDGPWELVGTGAGPTSIPIE